MKRHNYLIFFLIVIVLKITAQEKTGYTEGEKLNYEILKSIFKKPVYEPSVQEYNVQEILPVLNLSKISESAVFDSLQKSGTLKIEKDVKDFGLNIELEFPVLYNSSNSTTSVHNFNINILSKTMKLKLIESQLYNSSSQKLQVKNSSSIHFGRKNTPAINGRDRELKYDPNSIMMFNPLSDSIKADSACTGSATYKIKIITSYDSIRCNKKDVSKIIKLNGTSYQIVTIIDNKVVLAILHNKKSLDESGVISFDSINKSIIHHAKFTNHFYGKSDSVAHIRSSVISKKSYDLIRNNPKMTIAEFRKAMTDCPTNQKDQNYLILETDAPLTNDFLLYSPIYGFEKHLELKLRH